MTTDNAVIVFIKSPEKGRVKTRLAKGVGETAALELYRCFVMDVLDMVRSTPFTLRVYHHPENAFNRIRSWLGDDPDLFPQKGATLGDKMANALAETFAAGFERAVLIGSDLPDLPPGIIDTAFKGLDQCSAAIGPSRDGGYYLIGFTAIGFTPRIFHGIPWGTDQVFDVTLNRFSNHHVSHYTLPVWQDIDTQEDLQCLDPDPAGNTALHTTAYLLKQGVKL
ncbi:TIGR04282 family arsenosugar biosynthesis glycosyltransferase [uncultured Desulfobacter sp.]|uniref:TIGR04282 family arsenosugar biosynthesis glycosyltransferase n=1 Tax=uncultured Desulfobacter sp. TaxID=240139 RepID=UPI002AAAB361|nr:TIGR04282 family arsenosugar biosynthesis glycosyltransferase [uncultured Desulfobacter sp.]